MKDKEDNVNEEQDLIKQLEEDIKDIENKIKHSKTINIKINALKNLKKALLTGEILTPYIITAGLTFGIFSSIWSTPFVRDSYKQPLEIKKEIDKLGNIQIEQQYSSFSSDMDVILYYSKWTPYKDDYYSSYFKVYQIDGKSEDIVMKIIKEKKINNLEEIFGEPIETKTEFRNNLTEEEINSSPSLEAVFYSVDKNKYIYLKENAGYNIKLTLIWFFITLLVENFANSILDNKSIFDIFEYMGDVDNEYKNVEVNDLKKRLKTKLDNYNRLVRE